jgi:hypothetical protein
METAVSKFGKGNLMKICIGKNIKTGNMEYTDVTPIPDPYPYPANPEATLWVDAKNNVWMWTKDRDKFISGLCFSIPKDTRLVSKQFEKWIDDRNDAREDNQ